MATPTSHALCSASASERWLNCTAAPRFEENFPAETSIYAEEGTLAHAICEVFGRKAFNLIDDDTRDDQLSELQIHSLYKSEMLRTAGAYADFLKEKAMEYDAPPAVLFEQSVDLTDYVPDGHGTCDCIMVGGNLLRITDYKHGAGVAVSAKANSQMRLYALGALKLVQAIFGDAITDVAMAIVQPRVHDYVEEDRLSVPDLLKWGEEYVKPRAYAAYTGEGAVFCPGDHCRFCRGKAVCAARAEKNSAYEDFKGCVERTKSGYELRPMGDSKGMLTDLDVAMLLQRAADLKKWYEDLMGYALQSILAGKPIPGYKAVAGKSNRVFTADAESKVKSILTKQAGVKSADLYKPKEFKSPAMIEDLIGKKAFVSFGLDDYVTKPIGKPTLVSADDPRPAYNPAAADFAAVAKS